MHTFIITTWDGSWNLFQVSFLFLLGFLKNTLCNIREMKEKLELISSEKHLFEN